MRLILQLQTSDKYLPTNYNYYLSAAIYKLLKLGSPEFSEFLHTKGYELNGKKYKLFSYALRFERMRIDQSKITILDPAVKLYVSSPIVDDFIQNFVLGTFQTQQIEIADHSIRTKFGITQVESLPEVEFHDCNYFKLLSPLVLSTKRENRNELSQYFLRFNDDIPEINRVFNLNLKHKYELIYKKQYDGTDLQLAWDDAYIAKKLKENKRLTKKVSILKDGIRPVEIIANEVPFSLSGNKQLIKVGYECGFGEKNSMGFGLTEAINN
ncbi:MAG: putative RAMP superfamily DNA repair protein [Ignavibacteria bacterium]|nr:MAG: putative RAMP superfamily DNA repair protein [Ignavibacteria bacterium]KAF0157629.1 MAG: putative RAMP superfamily DNA repair protein [Ignavibacteria bacterium]